MWIFFLLKQNLSRCGCSYGPNWVSWREVWLQLQSLFMLTPDSSTLTWLAVLAHTLAFEVRQCCFFLLLFLDGVFWRWPPQGKYIRSGRQCFLNHQASADQSGVASMQLSGNHWVMANREFSLSTFKKLLQVSQSCEKVGWCWHRFTILKARKVNCSYCKSVVVGTLINCTGVWDVGL